MDLAQEFATLPRLKLRGLMCLPAIRESFDEQRVPFAQLREYAQMLRKQGLDIDYTFDGNDRRLSRGNFRRRNNRQNRYRRIRPSRHLTRD